MEIDDVLDLIEKVADITSSLISIWLIIAMMGDLLGINVFQAIQIVISRPWAIPKEWIIQYAPVWYAMYWALFFMILIDTAVTMKYKREGEMPPLQYERVISLAMFLDSFWLAIIFRKMLFTMITIFAAISFSYTIFGRKAE